MRIYTDSRLLKFSYYFSTVISVMQAQAYLLSICTKRVPQNTKVFFYENKIG